MANKMSDLISRVEAIIAIRETELHFSVESPVDLTQCQETMQEIFVKVLDAQTEAIEKLPSAEYTGEQAEEIIRCKDCRWHNGEYFCDNLNVIGFSPNDYCSLAERRNG